MFDFPPDTPWIFAWLGAAALVGLMIGWLLGRIGKGRFELDRNGLRAELDEALEARRSAEEAMTESGALSADLQQRLDDARTSLSDADREIDRLRSDVDAAETRIAELEAEDRSSEPDGGRDAVRLAAQLASAHEELDSLRVALSAASADTDARTSAAESEALEAISRAATLEEALSEAGADTDARIAAAESDALEAIGRAAELEEALSSATLERDTLRRQLEEAEASSPEHSAGLVGELRDNFAAARAEAEETAARLTEAEARLEETETRLAEARAELEEARSAADSEESAEAAIAARDHVVRELQERVAELTDIDDRLTAREAELGELRRSQAAVVAAKDAEIRSMRERFEALERIEAGEPPGEAAAEMAAALQASQEELHASQEELEAVRERSVHWEQEAAALRADLAAGPPPVVGEVPAPLPEPELAPSGVEERLDRMQEVLLDKEARIAFLADRIARLESNLGAVRRQAPASADGPEPPAEAPASAPAEPDDLTAIWGIGPAIQQKLNSVGITTYAQIAVLGPDDRARLGDMLGDFLDRSEGDDWVGQARRLIEDGGGTVPDPPLEPIRLMPPPAAVEPDDLTEINGIGPFIESTLNGLGVNTYAQIAAWTEEDAEEFGEALVIFRDRITREDWVDQARRLMQRR